MVKSKKWSQYNSKHYALSFIFLSSFPDTCIDFFVNLEKNFDLICIFETTYGVLELRFMFVIYFLESFMYYQWKEFVQTIPTIPNT